MEQSAAIDASHNCVRAFCQALKHRDQWTARRHCTETAWAQPTQLSGKALFRKTKRHGFKFNCGSQVYQENNRACILLYGYTGSADFAFFLYALVENNGNTAKVVGITDSHTHAKLFVDGMISPTFHLEQLEDSPPVRRWAEIQATGIANNVITSTEEDISGLSVSPIADFGNEYSFRTPIGDEQRSAYATLVGQIQQSQPPVLVVTSATGGAGKSSTALTLAKLLAETGAKTLLIDADLRKSSLSNQLRSNDSQAGFTDWVTGSNSLQDAVQSLSPHLDLMCSGSIINEPGELFSSPLLHLRLDETIKDYTHIIVDSAPCLEYRDSLQILGAHSASDSIHLVNYKFLFIASHASVPRIIVDTALSRLQEAGTTGLAFILNRFIETNQDSRMEVLIERCLALEDMGRAAIQLRVHRQIEDKAGRTHWLILTEDEEQDYRPIGMTEVLDLETLLTIYQQGPWARFDQA